MKAFSVPGPAWVAILTFVAGWLAQYFGDLTWTTTAIALIMAVIKFIEMYMTTPPTPPEPPPGVASDPNYKPVERPNVVARFLVGS